MKPGGHSKMLFWGCFIALVATAFSFVSRGMVLDEWQQVFDLTESQKGQIGGVGLWPFAVSIVLFSLIIDKIGYKVAMFFALACHIISTIVLITTKPGEGAYNQLYIGTLIVALGNGTVEAFINPVVATLFSKQKTKYLNILHAGWPGGLVLGGLIILFATGASWQIKVGLILLPAVVYGVILVKEQFPINERVAAKVPYRDMLAEVGGIGAFLIFFLISSELLRVFDISNPSVAGLPIGWTALSIGIVVAAGFFVYTKSLGQPLFVILMLIMIPLATTELGTDTWISSLMEKPMQELLSLSGGVVLVYTSLIMMILRFCAGPILHRTSPLGLLAISALIACLGLVFLSKATGFTLLLAATLYGFGKTFFWPTMLGVVSERFPKGGALTLNAISGVGMLGVGIIGSQLIGVILDTKIDTKLADEQPALHQTVEGTPQKTLFGTAPTLDPKAEKTLSKADTKTLGDIRGRSQKETLGSIAILPAIMLVAYLLLILYFKSKGGYKPVDLETGEDPGPAESTA